MSIQLRWNPPKETMLRLDFDSSWNWVDYQNVMHLCAHEIATKECPVDLMVVPAPNSCLPPGAFLQFRRSLSHAPANLGTIYVVAQRETVFRLMMEAFVHICPELAHNIILVNSPEEATPQPIPVNFRMPIPEPVELAELAPCLT